MNIAVILAGGSGTRTNYAVPKQFLTINNIPIIIHTMMNIQMIPCIDAMIVMLPKGWEQFVETYAAQYKITKLCGIFIGGASRHETISKAIEHMKLQFSEEDNVILLEANRPLIPRSVIEDTVDELNRVPAVIAVDPCYDSMYESKNSSVIDRCVDRNILFKGQMPEAAKMRIIQEIYNKAKNDGLEQTPTALFLHYGIPVYKIMGSPLSFKITTAEDIEILSLLMTRKN